MSHSSFVQKEAKFYRNKSLFEHIPKGPEEIIYEYTGKTEKVGTVDRQITLFQAISEQGYKGTQ